MLSAHQNIQYSFIGNLASPPVIADLMAKELSTDGLLSLAAGFTDNVVLPIEVIERSFDKLKKNGSNEYLQYGTNQGRQRLRELAIDVINKHPSESVPDLSSKTIISNGSQQSLYLCMQVLCNQGDIVLVQQPSYFVFLELLKGLGIKAVSIPCDDKGNTDFEKLEDMLKDFELSGDIAKVKAVYLVNYYANPSSKSMPIEEKQQLGNTFTNRLPHVPILEDAAYREIYFDKPWSAPSILSLPEYEALSCLYFGTFTKPFATGLKVGFSVSNNEEIIKKMLCLKGHQDFGTAHFNQAIVENMIQENQYDQHLSHIRKHYQRKSELMNQALAESKLSNAGWSWDKAEGGLLMWLKGPEHIDTSMNAKLCNDCVNAGVLYVPGDLCFAEGNPKNFIRLSFGAIEESKLQEAVNRFADTAAKLS